MSNKTYSCTVKAIPQNLEEFTAIRDEIANTPEGGVVAYILALHLYIQNPEEGTKAIIVAMDRACLIPSASNNSYKGFEVGKSDMSLMQSQLSKSPYLPASYIPSTTPQNAYTPSEPPYEFHLMSNKYSGNADEGKIKIFIPSSGADTPRPVVVKVNNRGIWKVDNFSSIVVGIRKPEVAIDDDL